jgi:hypothetical protein
MTSEKARQLHQCVRANFVFSELGRVLVLEAAHRFEHCIRHLRRARRSTKQPSQSRRRRDCLCSIRRVCHVGRKRRLIIIDEDGAVLQQSAALPPLSAANQLSARDGKLPFGRRRETGANARRRRSLDRRRNLGPDPEPSEAIEENVVDSRVGLAQRCRLIERSRDAVGDLAIV